MANPAVLPDRLGPNTIRLGRLGRDQATVADTDDEPSLPFAENLRLGQLAVVAQGADGAVKRSGVAVHPSGPDGDR